MSGFGPGYHKFLGRAESFGLTEMLGRTKRVAHQLDEATLDGGMDGLFVRSILPFLSWNYETKAWPRDAMVGVRLLELGSPRNVPVSDVRSQSGVEPPAFGRVHIPSTPYQVGLEYPNSSFPVHVSPDS